MMNALKKQFQAQGWDVAYVGRHSLILANKRSGEDRLAMQIDASSRLFSQQVITIEGDELKTSTIASFQRLSVLFPAAIDDDFIDSYEQADLESYYPTDARTW